MEDFPITEATMSNNKKKQMNWILDQHSYDKRTKYSHKESKHTSIYKSNKVKITTLNMRGFNTTHKQGNLEILLSETQIDILAISNTVLPPNTEPFLQINKSKFHYFMSSKNKSICDAGVGFIIRKP